MTRRELPEWIGKTPDTAIPARVKARIMAAQGDLCALCNQPFTPQNPPEFDHTESLVNGGENREGNLRALHRDCHRAKTNTDVAVKSKDARVRAKHFGLAKKKIPVGGWAAQRFKKMPDGRVVPR